NSVVMEETLGEAIAKIFGTETIKPPTPTIPSGDGTAEETLEQISQLYEKAQEALMTGDLSTYADYIEQIGALLK
ncbi:MAG: hypothetical protein KKB03_05085, partial [Nanoarchaeota archaeon]|nr:hypothetical protein [Nanoarchaeota archaeon]